MTDINLFESCPLRAQVLFSRCTSYFSAFGMQVSPSKTKHTHNLQDRANSPVLSFPSSSDNGSSRPVELIPASSSFKYLGVWLQLHGNIAPKNEQELLQHCALHCNRMTAQRMHFPAAVYYLNAVVAAKAWYVSQVVLLSKPVLKHLDTIARSALRRVSGLPSSCSDDALYTPRLGSAALFSFVDTAHAALLTSAQLALSRDIHLGCSAAMLQFLIDLADAALVSSNPLATPSSIRSSLHSSFWGSVASTLAEQDMTLQLRPDVEDKFFGPQPSPPVVLSAPRPYCSPRMQHNPRQGLPLPLLLLPIQL